VIRPVDPAWRSTRFSTAVVAAVTLTVTWLLVDAAGLTRRVLYGGAGAVLLAGILWLLASDRWRIAGAGLTGIALPVVSGAVLAGIGYTFTSQVRRTVPVGSVFLVLGATVAVFGAIATRDVLARETLGDCLRAGFRTTVVVGATMTLAALLRFASHDQPFSDPLAVLFDPSATLPLASFLALLGAALYGTRAAIHTLPIDALLDGTITPGTRRGFSTIDRWLSGIALPLALGTVTAVLLEIGQSTPYAWLPATLVEPLGLVVGSGAVRMLLALSAGVAAATLGLARFAQSTSRRPGRETLAAVAPYGTGLALSGCAILFHETFLSALTGRVERQLPAQLVVPFREVRSEALSSYGGELLALVVVTALLVVSLTVVALALLSVRFGLLDSPAPDASVAAVGLFTTAVFATVLDVSLALALIGVLASVLVWDVGEFGGTLGRELGSRARTLRTELVHGGGTLLVGSGAVVVALGIERTVTDPGVGSTVGAVALVGAVAAGLLLVVASR